LSGTATETHASQTRYTAAGTSAARSKARQPRRRKATPAPSSSMQTPMPEHMSAPMAIAQ